MGRASGYARLMGQNKAKAAKAAKQRRAVAAPPVRKTASVSTRRGAAISMQRQLSVATDASPGQQDANEFHRFMQSLASVCTEVGPSYTPLTPPASTGPCTPQPPAPTSLWDQPRNYAPTHRDVLQWVWVLLQWLWVWLQWLWVWLQWLWESMNEGDDINEGPPGYNRSLWREDARPEFPPLASQTAALRTSKQTLLTLHQYDEGRFATRNPAAVCASIPPEVALILSEWQLISRQQWQLIFKRKYTDAVWSHMKRMGVDQLWICGAAVVNAMQLPQDGESYNKLADNIDLAILCPDQAMIDAYARYGCSSECIFGVIGPRGWSQVHDKRGHRGHTGMTGCRRPGTEAYILNNSFHWMVILRVLHCPASGSWLWALHDPHPKTSRWAYVGDDVQLDAFIQAFIADGDRHTPVREHWAIPVSCVK